VTTLSKATEADIPQLIQLLNILFTLEAEFKPDECAQRKGLAMIVSSPDVGVILVARNGQSILAMVNLLFSVSTALGERVATLEDMIVAPSARGSGIGSTLLSYAIDFAQKSGVKRITLLTDYDNQAAQRFYSKHGFVKSSMVPLRLSVK
jgi:ribosomal protein S18 acetylase RimI-like enzyme